VSTEQDGPFRQFLKRVGHDDALLHKWWHGGFDEVFADPKMADFKDKLTETHKGVLRRGELDEIKKALDDEAVAMGGDPSANLGKNWALVRV
jgi:hypothetical protein